MPDDELWPRISIVTASYNQGRFIEETIRSVLLQGYSNLEYIVVDGGSTDASIDIIRRYAPWLSSWCSEPDHGQSDGINKGFRVASGEIVAWLNSDDLLTPGALQKVATRFTKDTRLAVLCGTAEVRTVDLSAVMWVLDDPPTTSAEILAYPEGRHIGQPSVFMSRNALNFPEPLRPDLHYVMDFELWLRLSRKCDFVRISETLSWMRHHLDAKTFRDNVHVFEELEPIIGAYSDLVTPARATALIKSCRRGRARAQIVSALSRVRGRERGAAIRSVMKALRIDRSIAATRLFYGALARICLPKWLQRCLLQVP